MARRISYTTFLLQEELNKHAAHGNLEEVEKILLNEKVSINWKDTRYGMTPLICAASNGHIDVLKLLISAGADLDLKDKVDDGGITALIEATRFNRIEAVRELIEAGANINAKDIGEETALYIASRDGHVEIVSALLAAGANVNAKYSEGWTALHNAARGGHNNVVHELLRYGADPKLKNNDSETAADVGRNDEVKTTISKGEAIRAKKLAEDEEKIRKEKEEREKLEAATAEKAAEKDVLPSLNELTLSLSSPRGTLLKAQLTDKDVEILQLKDQVVKMYSKMTFLEAENDSLRKRLVTLEQQHLLLVQSGHVSDKGTGSLDPSQQESMEAELRQLREQNLQLKTTLKSILNT